MKKKQQSILRRGLFSALSRDRHTEVGQGLDWDVHQMTVWPGLTALKIAPGESAAGDPREDISDASLISRLAGLMDPSMSWTSSCLLDASLRGKHIKTSF
ncbi:hypothetical protein RRG08_015041 [Elysia crispata]|uniref:Uncharacterized protein n=1 Tax=Elysia crispata TaxID=231223 RepID=A0AAE1B629_9GAST|nr:hypothetical protein RRG08_015041 [Elysia crispata]